MKILTSERMWNDVGTLVTCLFPGLLLLRLADKKSPCMDRLYYYTRQMEDAIALSKNKLSNLESNYKNSSNKFSYHKMYQYFLQTSEVSDYSNEFQCSITNREEVGEDEDNVSAVSNDVSDDDGVKDSSNEFDSDDSDDELEEAPNTLGERVFKRWEVRQNKLIHDLSIAGWMMSPSAEVMRDAANHEGHHRDAVERLLIKWILFEVS